MQNKIIIGILLCAAMLTGCRQRQHLTLREELFVTNAQAALTQSIGDVLGSKVKVESIRLLDSAWTEATIFNDTVLAAMQREVDEMMSIDNIFSEGDFLEEFDRIESLEKQMDDYRKNNKVFWGYKVAVGYKSGKQRDTVNCEIDRYGIEVRGLNAGAEQPMGELEDLIKKL